MEQKAHWFDISFSRPHLIMEINKKLSHFISQKFVSSGLTYGMSGVRDSCHFTFYSHFPPIHSLPPHLIS